MTLYKKKNKFKKIKTMERKDVYKSIDTEREYQKKETNDPNRVDMIEDFDMAHTLLCIDRFLKNAKENWYKDSPENNYENVMPYLRNICGVSVKMGEKYGMPERK